MTRPAEKRIGPVQPMKQEFSGSGLAIGDPAAGHPTAARRRGVGERKGGMRAGDWPGG